MIIRKHKILQNVIITGVVAWLLLFVFLPNLMIIGTSFFTRSDTNLVDLVFTWDNYIRLSDPMYAQVMLHSLNMALIATFFCLVIGYPFAFILARLPKRIQPLMLFLPVSHSCLSFSCALLRFPLPVFHTANCHKSYSLPASHNGYLFDFRFQAINK